MKKYVIPCLGVLLFFQAEAQKNEIEPFLGTVDALFKQYAENKKLPGVAYGIVYQGQLIHAKGIGFSPASTPFVGDGGAVCARAAWVRIRTAKRKRLGWIIG